MAITGNGGEDGQLTGGVFATTQWGMVLAAKTRGTAPADEALEKLCRIYWPPLYAFIRREGYGAHEAQDLTQEFLSRLVHKEWLHHLQDQRAKFRSFLLTFLKHFLSDERDRAQAQKRGGGKPLISLDAFAAEEHDALVSIDGVTAERLYERRWARAVMAEAVHRLEAEYAARGKLALFTQFKELQPGERGERTFAEIAAQLGMTEQAIKNARHAFNRRYAELIREEIAQTVVDPAELEAEIQYLLQVFSN